ncbi:MAG TPA: tagaturonate epimerase family protein [Patescibacteria group bacterium]|nr:tagaturonate epimerase family protein [Patescibacteria group bacterium]
MLTLERFSVGIGDRFGQEARAQLRAFQVLAADAVQVTPVWNKSNREHTFIGSEPQSVFVAAQAAVKALGWKGNWHVDADHIRLETVDRFIPWSDFFTIDVADFIGKPAAAEDVKAFVDRHPELIGQVSIKGLGAPLRITRAQVERVAAHYLVSIQEAGRIYRHISAKKGAENIIAEVSMDETEAPQTPPELLVILVLLAEQKVPAQTIAPKFTGRFNKGVDYVGDLAQFDREFNDDLAVIAHAVDSYGLPANLKLSVHSGSDKFSLYPIIRRALTTRNAGVHLKTAGTTWLEELIGLSEAGGDGLQLTKEIYAYALEHVDELCGPYASVIDIHRDKLPSPSTVNRWTGPQLANALRHIPTHPEFNPHLRQLLHVSFKLAARAGTRYLDLLKANEAIVAKQVTDNLYQRHLRPLFVG